MVVLRLAVTSSVELLAVFLVAFLTAFLTAFRAAVSICAGPALVSE